MNKYYNMNKEEINISEYEGRAIKISTTYVKDTYNWFYGRNQARGYYIVIEIVEIEQNEYKGQKYQTEKSTPVQAYKMLLKEVTRSSKKAEADAEHQANNLIPTLLYQLVVM